MRTKVKRKVVQPDLNRPTVLLEKLPGTARPVEAFAVKSITDAAPYLRTRRAVTAAGSAGALKVWRDSKPQWRCEFSKRGEPLDSQLFSSVAGVVAWLETWWPRLGM